MGKIPKKTQQVCKIRIIFNFDTYLKKKKHRDGRFVSNFYSPFYFQYHVLYYWIPFFRREKALEGKSRNSHSVHCPYFTDDKQEFWWCYISDRKNHALVTPPSLLTNLVEREEVELKFTAPPKPGKNYYEYFSLRIFQKSFIPKRFLWTKYLTLYLRNTLIKNRLI